MSPTVPSYCLRSTALRNVRLLCQHFLLLCFLCLLGTRACVRAVGSSASLHVRTRNCTRTHAYSFHSALFVLGCDLLFVLCSVFRRLGGHLLLSNFLRIHPWLIFVPICVCCPYVIIQQLAHVCACMQDLRIGLFAHKRVALLAELSSSLLDLSVDFVDILVGLKICGQFVMN